MQDSQLLTQDQTTSTGFGAAVDTWTGEQYQTAGLVPVVLDPGYDVWIRIGETSYSVRVADPSAIVWLADVAEKLSRIAALEVDWDSYGAAPVNQQTLIWALSVLIYLMGGRSALPKISASVAGGVEFEWHQPGMGLEIEVCAPSMIHAYFYDDDRPNDEWEDDVGVDNMIRLGPLIDRVTT